MHLTTSNPPINSDLYNLALHTSGLTLGPMPTQMFLDTFLPKTGRTGDRIRRGPASRIPNERVNERFVSAYSPLSGLLIYIQSR